jgi:hypothetical protein
MASLYDGLFLRDKIAKSIPGKKFFFNAEASIKVIS